MVLHFFGASASAYDGTQTPEKAVLERVVSLSLFEKCRPDHWHLREVKKPVLPGWLSDPHFYLVDGHPEKSQSPTGLPYRLAFSVSEKNMAAHPIKTVQDLRAALRAVRNEEEAKAAAMLIAHLQVFTETRYETERFWNQAEVHSVKRDEKGRFHVGIFFKFGFSVHASFDEKGKLQGATSESRASGGEDTKKVRHGYDPRLRRWLMVGDDGLSFTGLHHVTLEGGGTREEEIEVGEMIRYTLRYPSGRMHVAYERLGSDGRNRIFTYSPQGKKIRENDTWFDEVSGRPVISRGKLGFVYADDQSRYTGVIRSYWEDESIRREDEYRNGWHVRLSHFNRNQTTPIVENRFPEGIR